MKNLAYYNLKLISNLNVLVAAVFLVIISLMLDMRFLNFREAAQIGETYVSIIGIILFSYLCTIEYNKNIKETIITKKTSFTKVILIRIAFILAFTVLCTSIITGIELFNDSKFSGLELIAGTSITIFFLGMIGVTFSNIFENDILGYMAAFMYYFFELFDTGKHTKDLYLFSLMKGSFSYGKYYLLLIAIILLGINLGIIYRKS